MKTSLSTTLSTFPITMGLIILSCLISTITWFGYIDSTLVWFLYDTQSIFSGQIWRLITPIFLHFPAMGIIFAHLAFNMIWLYQFGSLIEYNNSSKFLLVLVITSGVISNIAQSVASATSATSIFGGMSGVVYALLGYIFLIKRLKPQYPAYVPNNIAYFLIGFMLLAAIGVFGNGIANTAHIAGFAVGLMFAGIVYKIPLR